MINGQVNLYDAIRKQVDFKQGEKEYKLRTDRVLPTLIARARGWHLEEKHFTVDGEAISGSLFDFGLYFFHNAFELVKRGTGPYFYLPKMESHLEARLWNDVFKLGQDYIGMPRGTIRGTVLIETITAAFEMDEIIYELREHSAGLNCGRWDYIFSVIKKFRQNPAFVLPDRSSVTMTVPFMDAYVRLLIKTCHRRGVHAMGGMAAQIPIKDNPEANEKAMDSVRADKLREVRAGHDGTWVAHPALAAIASEIFNKEMPTPNQLFKRREEVNVTKNDLLNMNVPGGITEEGIRKNLNIGLGYMEGWLRGVGCVPINYLMEDAATAEVSRSQLWQWCKHGVKTSEGVTVDKGYALKLLHEQADELSSKAGKGNKYQLAARYFEGQVTGEDYADFLTRYAFSLHHPDVADHSTVCSTTKSRAWDLLRSYEWECTRNEEKLSCMVCSAAWDCRLGHHQLHTRTRHHDEPGAEGKDPRGRGSLCYENYIGINVTCTIEFVPSQKDNIPHTSTFYLPQVKLHSLWVIDANSVFHGQPTH